MSRDKSMMRKVAVGEKDSGVAPSSARKEMRMWHQAPTTKAIRIVIGVRNTPIGSVGGDGSIVRKVGRLAINITDHGF